MKVRILGALVVGFVMAGVCFGQLDPGKLRFNGVGLGSTYGQVVKALGKPSRATGPKREECTGGRERDLYYNGASVYFMDEGTKTFKAVGFEVKSPKYVVSGIRVGDTQLTVRRVLGSKFTVDMDQPSGSTIWTYAMGGETGSATITFKNGKVVSIASAYMMC